jgi:CRISPR-associated protein Csd1
VFWAQKDDAEIEEGFAAIFGERDDPDARAEQVRALLGAVQSGQFDGGRGDKLFYVLGLAPNAARVAVRFWHAAPLHEIAHHIRQWFDDLKMIRGGKDQEYPSLFRLLAACAQQGKADNIPPNLGGDIMRAILSGSPFPATWLNAAVLRCRAEQNVTYLRAAGIKASLNRLQRFQPNQSLDKELSDMLDLENNSPAYRLGRLFAAGKNPGRSQPRPQRDHPRTLLRRRFQHAGGGFHHLAALKNHHLAKLTNRGRAVNFERLLGEIMGGLNDFPKHLSLPEQGRFALGYYHQRQDFFSKPNPANPCNPPRENPNEPEQPL